MPEDVVGTHAWVDGSAGIAGDMLLGALLDAGASLRAVQAAVDAVAPDTVRLHVEEVLRAGLRATKVHVELGSPDQPHRSWRHVRTALESAALQEAVAEPALRVFRRIAAVEADAHGVEVEDVHFHEVGAWDSIADVVGCCAALADLGVATVSGGPVELGSGRVRTAHGVLPVPVPAVLELARGWQVRAGERDGELATPTGMALLTTLAERCEGLPALRVTGTGVGAGTREDRGRPNVVRVVLGERVAEGRRAPAPAPVPVDTAEQQTMVVLEANVDDLDPRVWPGVLTELLAAGAADAWLVPILMKKGRPAHTLCVLASVDAAAPLREKVFVLTTTIGVRETTVDRHALPRSTHRVRVAGHEVAVKVSEHAGRVVTATPEFDDVAAVAAAEGIPVRRAFDLARAATEAAGLALGTPTSPQAELPLPPASRADYRE
ncbi:MAG TPA: nickel pincer cofactor biosynthesis protein LarC [Segeticoccus sp.]|uniref:nickel pincer cofactor biosynthesis protein LarC n=1 Tax=Segeticoccus sp. TaxID=2706531 RepID=UPI002D80BB0A|nr:nickel pincer cofactor biosynthesis protein LarC [Segeticoccus sp.]HET8601423.1 nickel pincer cofactor biosynthesis protein LarC [Segeticoccus sp.]